MAKSLREMRRAKARQDRKLLLEMGMSSEERQKAALFRNGITIDDLQKEYDKGAKDGRKFAEDFSFHVIYAAFLITMIDHYGMEQEKALELLRDIDKQVVLCAEDEELTAEAWERTGVEIDWKDPFERIVEKE